MSSRFRRRQRLRVGGSLSCKRIALAFCDVSPSSRWQSLNAQGNIAHSPLLLTTSLTSCSKRLSKLVDVSNLLFTSPLRPKRTRTCCQSINLHIASRFVQSEYRGYWLSFLPLFCRLNSVTVAYDCLSRSSTTVASSVKLTETR